MTGLDEALLVLLLLAVALFLVVGIANDWPVTANLCHLNGHVVHGNLTVAASYGAQNITARFTCP